MQGYLPIALIVNAIKNDKTLELGFYDAGAQIVTADSRRHGQRPAGDQLRRGDPARRRSGRHRRVLQAVDREGDGRHSTAGMQPIAAEAE